MSPDRYSRQVLLDKIGKSGQQSLGEAHVTVVGCGGLGSIAAPYLAGAGVGRITLIDGDKPDVSNLHRQVMYSVDDTNQSKASALKNKINSLNPEIQCDVIPTMIDKSNVATYIDKGAIVLECTDSIQVKYLINDYCHIHRIPMVYGAIYKYEGYVTSFANQSNQDLHLRDIFPTPNDDLPRCSEVGVLGTIAGMIGLLQANEAIKMITGAGRTLTGELLTYNALTNDQLKLKLRKSFHGDIQKIFDQSSYQSSSCQTHELSLDVYLSQPESYRLISILEDKEHVDIAANVERKPMSKTNFLDLELDSQAIIFYCLSGKRSAAVVQSILKEEPKAEVFSLKGGIRKI